MTKRHFGGNIHSAVKILTRYIVVIPCNLDSSSVCNLRIGLSRVVGITVVKSGSLLNCFKFALAVQTAYQISVRSASKHPKCILLSFYRQRIEVGTLAVIPQRNLINLSPIQKILGRIKSVAVLCKIECHIIAVHLGAVSDLRIPVGSYFVA